MPAGSINTSWTVHMDTRIFYAKNIRYEHRCQVLLKRRRKYHPVPNHERELFSLINKVWPYHTFLF